MTTPFTGAPERTPIRLRRSPRWLALGLLATVLGGLATAVGFLTVGASDSVVVLTRTVHRGEAVAAADLGVVSVGRGAGLRTVSAAGMAELVGQRAATDLPAGSLLVEGSLGARDLPAGQARVGVRVTAGRLPSTTLLPGTPVLVVALPAAGATGQSDAPLPASVSAAVVNSPEVQADGSHVLDLNLPADRAEAVARLAAADRVALIRREATS